MLVFTLEQNFLTFNVTVYKMAEDVLNFEEQDYLMEFNFSTKLRDKNANLFIHYNSLFRRNVKMKLQVQDLDGVRDFRFIRLGLFSPRMYKHGEYEISEKRAKELDLSEVTRYKAVTTLAVILKDNKPIGGVVAYYEKNIVIKELFVREDDFDAFYFLLAYIYHVGLNLSPSRYGGFSGN